MINTKIIAFSKQGADIAQQLIKKMNNNYSITGYYKEEHLDLIINKQSLHEFSKQAFNDSRLIIYVGAIGIATRAIAPFIISKDKDPAIICIDDKALYVIPILSGHLGNANNYAKEISHIINAQAIITTATDINKVFAVDSFALKNNLLIDNLSMIKVISAHLLNNKKIGFHTDYVIDSKIPDFVDLNNKEIGIYIGDDLNIRPFKQTISLRHRKYVVGIGCKKNKNSVDLDNYFRDTLTKLNIDHQLVCTITSIDLKKDEQAINDLANKYRYGFKTFSCTQLNKIKGDFTTSEFVKKTTGVDNVCERSVAMICGTKNIILKKNTHDGMSIAIGIIDFKCEF